MRGRAAPPETPAPRKHVRPPARLVARAGGLPEIPGVLRGGAAYGAAEADCEAKSESSILTP